MFARVTTFALEGIEPRPVSVEADVRPGLPAFTVVGLADTAVRESRERVRAAIQNSGFQFPQQRITVSLAPAYLRKQGAGFDLAVAVALLAASGQIPAEALDATAVAGELSLDGAVRACRGVLGFAEGASRDGLARLMVPAANAAEAALVGGMGVLAVDHLALAGAVLRGTAEALDVPAGAPPPADAPAADLADVRGQDAAAYALVVAAAGGHSSLLIGPPGVGKTMLARRMPGILPPLARDEALAVTRIHSAAGIHPGGLAARRPFRAPHHTVSAAGLVGGGVPPSPGEVTLAHHGVLFLDELTEFARGALEALRQPLEDGHVTIVRGQSAVRFPTRCTLVAAANPCACGHGGAGRACRCNEADLARHHARLSGPLRDRLDISQPVERPEPEALAKAPRTTSSAASEQVAAARERQLARADAAGAAVNAEIPAGALRRIAAMDGRAERLLAALYAEGALSLRGRDRILRVARTLADLDGRAGVGGDDVLLAAELRGPGSAPLEAAA